MVGYSRIPIDIEILASLKKYDINIEFARASLEANKHNNATTTYYLLHKKAVDAGDLEKMKHSFDSTMVP